MSTRSTRRRVSATVLLAGIVLLSAGAGLAAVTAAPMAITGPVSAVGPASATASGTVNPNGQATSWYFEYGTTTSYGKKTSTKSAGSGTTNVGVSAALTGLASGTTYHYRLVATSGDGTTRGADGIFTTSSAPVAVTGAASDITVTSATLAGTVDPNGRATTWYFEYGTSTSYGSKTPAKSAGSGTAASGVSAPVSGLTPGRLYHYRIVATSDAGTSRGGDRTFSTAGAPTAVTASATAVTTKAAKLSGKVTANGLTTTWYFEYGTSTAYGAKTSARSAGKGTSPANVSWSLTGLRATTAYHYRLVASNASGTSLGADRTFVTAGAPIARTGPARDIGSTSAALTGSVNPQGRRTTWYFEHGTTTRYGSRTPVATAASGFADQAVTVSISSLRPGTTYHYRLVARSDAGTIRGADLRFTTVGVTLTARARKVVYGRAVMLSGRVPITRSAEQVTVLARRFGSRSLRPVGIVVTDEAGFWRYLARPTIRTAYAASWNGGSSRTIVIGVRPAVSFRRITRARFTTRVVAERSFAGRRVQLQRRTAAGRWVTVRRVRLNGRSSAIIRAPLRRGTSTLRIAISVNQAGRGYLAGISRTIVYRRR